MEAAEVWINKAVQKEEGETIKADRSFEEKLKDINENPEDWEKSDEFVKDSTRKVIRAERVLRVNILIRR